MITYYNKQGVEPFHTVILAFATGLVCFYDPNDNTIKIEKIWQKSNNYDNSIFYFLSAPDDCFVKNGKWEGYDWIIDKIPRHLAQRAKFDEQTTLKASELYKAMQIKEWYEVCDKQSADEFLYVAGYFADYGVYSVSDIENGKRILFDSGCGFYIVLDCEEIESEVLDELSKTEFFMDAGIEFSDEGICLTLDKGYVMSDDEDGSIKLKCRAMKGKIIISKLTQKDRKNKIREVLDI